MEELIQQYANHLRNERNVSPHTLRNYLSDLRQFRQFLEQRDLTAEADRQIDVRRLDVHVVRAYLASLTRDRKKSSMGRKLAALKGFFRYLLANHKVDKNPLL
ncbi:MAG TPA: site-specific integrase, partial [Candidatus Binatia bacterium]